MKIIAVIDSTRGGGAERIFSYLSRDWAEHGYDVDVHTFKHKNIESPVKNLTIQPLLDVSSVQRKNIFAIPRLIKRLRHVIKTSKPALVVSFMDQANILTLLATLGMSVPVVVAERTHPSYSSLLTDTRFPFLRPLYKALRNLCYRRAASIVLQSDRSIAYFPERLHGKICVIANPIIAPSSEGISVEIAQPTILALGRLTVQKRFDLTIQAFEKVAIDFPQWHLLITGSGAEQGNLERMADASSCAERIHFLGYQGDTASLFKQAAIFVLSSAHEGFPVALGEALHAGVPAIATDCLTGPREMLGESEYGKLVPVNDALALSAAMRTLMSNGSERERLAAAGKVRAEEFAPAKILPLWRHSFEEIINKNRGIQT